MRRRSIAALLGFASLCLLALPANAARGVMARFDPVRGGMRTTHGKIIPLTGYAAGVLSNKFRFREAGRGLHRHYVATGRTTPVTHIPGPFPANEPSVAVDPLNASHLIASSNDYRLGTDADGGLYSSFNHGLSWYDSVVQFTISGPYYYNSDGDPANAIDRHGNDFFGSLGFNRTGGPTGNPQSAILLAQSHPGVADQFVDFAPANVDTEGGNYLDDKDSLAVDNNAGGTPWPGSTYSVWTLFSASDSQIKLAYSRNSGLTFAQTIVSHPGGTVLCPFDGGRCGDNQGSSPAVNRGGRVWVAYENFDTPTLCNQIFVALSSNGGASFGNPIKVATDCDISPIFGFRVNSFPNLAINTSTGQLYVTWTDSSAGQNRILISTSSTGTTWSAPRTVNSDAGTNFHFFPAITVGSTGNVYVSFYSNANHGGMNLFDYFYRRLSPALVPQTSDTQLNTAAIDPTACCFGGGFIGDYTSIASDPPGAYAVWTGTTTGVQGIEGALAL